MYTSVAEEFERRNPKRGADSPPGGVGVPGSAVEAAQWGGSPERGATAEDTSQKSVD